MILFCISIFWICFSTGFCGGADAITDEIANRYDQCFDAQTVRAKLLEYARLGILLRIRVGRSYQYRLQDTTLKTLFADIKNRDDALSFFTEVAPLGIIGHYLQQGNNLVNKALCSSTILLRQPWMTRLF